MFKRKYSITGLLTLLLSFQVLAQPSVDGLLQTQVDNAPLGLTPVVITYFEYPNAIDFTYLNSLSISGGVVLNELPMVLTAVNGVQLDALSGREDIASLYANRTYELFTNESRTFIGVTALRADNELTTYNGGIPVSGQDIGVAYVDTGIDATHPDLQLGENVEQNVFFPLAEVPASPPAGFVPPIYVEDAPISDVEGGHGTHGAGVVAGTGAASGNFYGGVAPGADLIGLVAGNDAGLSNFAILQAYDYALVNQFRYNIRVCNNSFGATLSNLPYDPFGPINTATRFMHDRFITVVFAAGNAGDVPGAINPLSVAPWVISVAAGNDSGKGIPASFSSRGENNGTGTDTAGQPADPLAPPNLRPDITAPGVDIVSTRSKGPGITNFAGTALGQDLDIAPAFLPFYTTSQGTSFAAPHVTGVVALMMEANALLSPDQVVTLLQGTATPMPNFEPRVVGAGYVDAHNAVRAAAELAPVAHPADLSLEFNRLYDVGGDQLGTQAQDIVGGSFAYDAVNQQIVYSLSVANLAERNANMQWTQSSVFDGITLFVSTSINELGEASFEYGTIAPDPNTGVSTLTTLGPADSGAFVDDQIIVRLGVDKVNTAVGYYVVGTVSTTTAADAQILIGTSLTGGLLLNSDTATGTRFFVSDQGSGDPGAGGNNGDGGTSGSNDPMACGEDDKAIKERFAGAITSADPVTEVSFTFHEGCGELESKLNYHPGNQYLAFELLDADGDVIAVTRGHDEREIEIENLPPGEYHYRVSSDSLTKNVDFVIKSLQEED